MSTRKGQAASVTLLRREQMRSASAPTSAPEHFRKIYGIAMPVCALARNDASVLSLPAAGWRETKIVGGKIEKRACNFRQIPV